MTNDLKSQILEIERGTTIGLLKIPITDDDIYEGNETFTVILREPDNASFLNSLRDPNFNSQVYITVTIEDDELLQLLNLLVPILRYWKIIKKQLLSSVSMVRLKMMSLLTM